MGQSYALPLPVTSKHIQRVGNKHFRSATVSMQGWRRDMEDSHVADCNDNYGLFGVFDGHSGSNCAKQCSKMFKERIAKAKLPLSEGEVQQLCLGIDNDFLTSTDCTSGSTAVFGIVVPKGGKFELQVGNVGDSRIVIGTNGVTKAMTVDHQPSLPQEEARIKRAGGTVENDRVNGELAMSRAMGDRPYKVNAAHSAKKQKKSKDGASDPTELQVIAKPDVTGITLQAKDWFLVACDGIFEPESFTNEEVIKFINKELSNNDDLGEVLCALCTEALKRGSTDNMTAMIVQLQDGTGYGPAEQFLPGPFDVDMGAAKRCYFSFAEEFGGLSRGQVLASRYDILQQRLKTLKASKQLEPIKFQSMKAPQLKEWLQIYGNNEPPASEKELIKACTQERDQHQFYEEGNIDRLQEELEWYGEGPPKGLKGPKRTKWFEDLVPAADDEEEEEDEDGDFDISDLSPEQLQQLGQDLPPDALKQLLDQTFQREMQEEMEMMQEEVEEEGESTANKPKKSGKGKKAKGNKVKAAAAATPATGKKRKRTGK